MNMLRTTILLLVMFVGSACGDTPDSPVDAGDVGATDAGDAGGDASDGGGDEPDGGGSDADGGASDGGGVVPDAGPPAGCFSALPEVTGPASVSGLAVGELTRDGGVDVVLVSRLVQAAIYVFPGRGDGTFLPMITQNLSGPFQATRVAVADLDLDGWEDLLVSRGSDEVEVLLNPASGPFSSLGRFEAASNMSQLLVAHLDGDAVPDVAGAGSQLSVLLGGVGGALTPLTPSLSFPASYLATGDVNGDSVLDFVGAPNSAGTVYVSLGDGDGTFQPLVSRAFVFGYPRGIATVDLDGDGRDEVVVSVDGTGDPEGLYVLSGWTDGGFPLPELSLPVGNVGHVVAAPLYGDARLAVATGASVEIVGYVEGALVSLQTLTATSGIAALSVADIDGDERLDLVGSTEDGFQVFLNRCP